MLSQGYHSGLALREIGPFLRYMESEFNVKVHGGGVQGIFTRRIIVTGLLLGRCLDIVNLFTKTLTAVSSVRCGITTKAGTPWWPS